MRCSEGESLPRRAPSLNKTQETTKEVLLPAGQGSEKGHANTPEQVCSTSRNKTLVVAALIEPAATPEGGIRELEVSSAP